MSQNFQAGDYLIFQIESAYGLLRILAIEEEAGEKVFHLAAYNEMFLDIDSADAALANHSSLTISKPHLALTNRAFESTQVARMKNEPLSEAELKPFEDWKQGAKRKISDLSVRLLLGLR
jgi:oligoendopeptidase F